MPPHTANLASRPLPLIEEAKKEVVATMVLKKFVVKPSPSLSQSDPSRRRATLLLTLPPLARNREAYYMRAK
jgi:hypothetical protein